MARLDFNISPSHKHARRQLLCPRMRSVVRLLQSLGCQMRVNLRRHQMRVAEQLLHAAQIGAGIQQMRGVTVPQFVRCERWIQTGCGQMFFQPHL